MAISAASGRRARSRPRSAVRCCDASRGRCRARVCCGRRSRSRHWTTTNCFTWPPTFRWRRTLISASSTPSSGCFATITYARQFDYTLGTTAIVNGVQSALMPMGRNELVRGALGCRGARARRACPTRGAGLRWIARIRPAPAGSCGTGPLLGTKADLGTIPIQSGRPGSRYPPGPDRGLSHQASRRALRILRHGLDADVAQPGHSRPPGRRL